IAAAGTSHIVNVESRYAAAYVSVNGRAYSRGHPRRFGGKTHSAQSVKMLSARDEHRVARPPATRLLRDSCMAVPAPRLIYQNESVSGVSEPELQAAANSRGDAVIRDGR